MNNFSTLIESANNFFNEDYPALKTQASKDPIGVIIAILGTDYPSLNLKSAEDFYKFVEANPEAFKKAESVVNLLQHVPTIAEGYMAEGLTEMLKGLNPKTLLATLLILVGGAVGVANAANPTELEKHKDEILAAIANRDFAKVDSLNVAAMKQTANNDTEDTVSDVIDDIGADVGTKKFPSKL